MEWPGDLRALFAVPYCGSSFSKGDKGRGARRRGRAGRGMGKGDRFERTREEGCIVVAGSDECVRFHEVWAGEARETGGGRGVLAGSEILEGLEGVEVVGGEVIR